MNTKRILLLSVLSLVLVMALSAVSFAQVYVKNTGGDDLVGDGTMSNPYKTIAKGITASATGGTLYVYADTYTEAAITVSKALTMVAMELNGLKVVTIDNGLTINPAAAADVVSLGETGEKWLIKTGLTLTKGDFRLVTANVTMNSATTITRTAGTFNNTPTVTNVNVTYNGTADITAGPELAANIGSGVLTVNITAGKKIIVPSAVTTTGGITITTGNADFNGDLNLGAANFTNAPAGNTVNLAGGVSFTNGRFVNTLTGAVTVTGNVAWSHTAAGGVNFIDNAGNGNVTFNGTVNFNKSSTGATNVTGTILNAGTGTLTFAQGFATASATISGTTYTVKIDGNNGSTGALVFNGAVTMEALANASTGNVTLTGGTVAGVVANNAGGRIELKSGTTFSNATIGNGNAASIIKLNGNTLTLSSNTAAVTNTGKIISDAAATVGTGVVAITGTGATITGGEVPNVTVASGKGLTLAGGVTMYGNFTSAGAVALTGNLTMNGNGTYTQNVGGTLGLAGNTFEITGNFVRSSNVPGDVTYTTGILKFSGSAAQTFTSGASLKLYDVVVAKTASTVLTLTNTIEVDHDFTITSGSVKLEDNHIRMVGGASGTFTNTGGYTSNGIGYLIFEGTAAQTITGTGIYSNIDIRNAAGVNATSAINFSGTLILRTGTLALGANTFTFKSDLVTVPAVIRWNGGNMTGGPITVAAGTVYDLTYMGTTMAAASEWKTGTGMRNLTVATGSTSSAQVVTGAAVAITSISGELKVNENQELKLNTFDLDMTGAGKTHTVAGKVTVTAAEKLNFKGNGSSLVGTTSAGAGAWAEVPETNIGIAAGETFTSTNIKKFAANLTQANGTSTISMNTGGDLIGNLTLTNGSMDITIAGSGSTHTGTVVLTAGTLKYTRGSAAADQVVTGPVTLTAGTMTLGSSVKITGATNQVAGNLDLGANNYTAVGAYTRTGAGSVTATTGKLIIAAAGAVNFTPFTSFSVPNFEIDNTGANVVTVVGNGFTISNAFTHTSGNLDNNSFDVTISGNTYTYTAGAYAATGGGTIILTGAAPTITAAGDLAFVSMKVNAGADNTVTFKSNGATNRTFSFSGTFDQTSGNITHSSNTMTMTGTFTRTAGTWTQTTGYLIFNTATAFTQGTGFAVDNLKIEQSISGTVGTAFTVNKYLWLNAGTLTMTTLKLTLGDNATVERNADNAQLSSIPTFAGVINVLYKTAAHTTVANFYELPSSVKNFEIGAAAAAVTLPKNLTVTGTLTLDGALTLTSGSKDMTMADGSTLVLKKTGSAAILGTDLLRAGKLHIVYNGAAVTSTRELGAISSSAHPNTTGDVTIKSVVYMDANITFQGKLTFDGGNLEVSNNVAAGGVGAAVYTVNVQGDVVQTGLNKGFFSMNATYMGGVSPSSATVNFSGANNTALTLGGLQTVHSNNKLYITKTNPENLANLTGGTLDFAANTQVLYLVNGVLTTDASSVVVLKQSRDANNQPTQGFDRTAVTGTKKSHIAGNVKKFVSNATADAVDRSVVTFPVGTSNPNYRPLSIFFKNQPGSSVNITVNHVNTRAGGENGFPISSKKQDGSLLKLTNYPGFFWYVKSDIPLAPSYVFDIEAQAEGYAEYVADLIQNVRLIRRDSGNYNNQWLEQKNYNTDTRLYDNSTVNLTWPVVKAIDATGGITTQGSLFTYSQINKAPTFTTMPVDVAKNEGETVELTWVAADYDLGGDAVTMAKVLAPEGASALASGKITWAIPYTVATKATPSVTQKFVVSATDTYGPLTTYDTVVVTVNNVNRAPVLTTVEAKTIKYTEKLDVTLAATDVDGDALTYAFVSITPAPFTATNLPVLATTKLTWQPEYGDATKTYAVKVSVTDGVAPAVEQTFNVTVNRSRIKGDISGDNSVLAEDASLALQHAVSLITITDPEALWAGDVSGNTTVNAYDASLILQKVAGYSVVFAPAALGKSEASTGSIEWKNPVAKADAVTMGVKVSDDARNITSMQFTMKFNAAVATVSEVASKLPEDWTLVYKVDDGTVTVAAAGLTPVTGEAAVVSFKLKNKENRLTVSGEGFLNDGAGQTMDATEISMVPSEFGLDQNYPNPFNPTTTIKYRIAQDASVNLVIYNMQGQKIRSLVAQEQKAGYYSIVWDGRNDAGQSVASGLYLYRVQAGSFVASNKMMLIK